MEFELNNILIAFITGLTSGGLSCLAVQGGLLASSLSNQIENDFQDAGKKRRNNKKSAVQDRSKLTLPILAFLIAKLIAYSILGFFLGLLGQVFQLSPISRAILQIAIGIFMLGNALRMLNVHPIFRFFVFEPPAFLRRRLRKTASGSDGSNILTPAFLGFMTVLIPCGVAQAMMAVALGTGNPLQGAALMFAFTLGTSPVFFAVSYFATQIGARLEKYFVRFVAIVVLVLAVVTINSGLTLAGSPLSFSRLTSTIFEQPQNTIVVSANSNENGSGSVIDSTASSNEGSGVVIINVQNSGYSPSEVHAKAGVPITLRLITNNVRSCSRAFIIPSLGVQQILAETGEAEITLQPQASGTKIPFSCSMGMFSGTIIFD
jgi:sulfite exporter TauE/SafE